VETRRILCQRLKRLGRGSDIFPRIRPSHCAYLQAYMHECMQSDRLHGGESGAEKTVSLVHQCTHSR